MFLVIETTITSNVASSGQSRLLLLNERNDV